MIDDISKFLPLEVSETRLEDKVETRRATVITSHKIAHRCDIGRGESPGSQRVWSKIHRVHTLLTPTPCGSLHEVDPIPGAAEASSAGRIGADLAHQSCVEAVEIPIIGPIQRLAPGRTND
eukprot:SAG31_NODE_3091_length_4683_cov_47.153578_5_plen_121_part_00